jgi:hypothetical protein
VAAVVLNSQNTRRSWNLTTRESQIGGVREREKQSYIMYHEWRGRRRETGEQVGAGVECY